MAYAFVAVLILAISLNTAQGVAPAARPGITAPAVLPSAARVFLEAHNQARAAVGVGPLKWSEQLANATGRLARYQRNKMDCQFANLTGRKYGGNQYWGSGAAKTPRLAVDSWVKEKNYYNYANNSCEQNHMCALYTQVVWKNSSELGTARFTSSIDCGVLRIVLDPVPDTGVTQRWVTYCNGQKVGFARRLEVGEEKWVLEKMQMVSAGAGILLHKGSDACGYKYLRGQFE
ncbi:hypothetical protein CRYUN_Cryun17cG0130000 [Craigia yunnanensis]